eukprot:TRINITY_DN5441_c1_g2_i1.p1 TRINITY_DN5441_c1_g2~~TRINITY_DN5441_c1_g2_i1.p1  ORF type:complete len:506 (-),score=210.56 TRINITY_DN5441_c1_g2_i1:389-1906(-)
MDLNSKLNGLLIQVKANSKIDAAYVITPEQFVELFKSSSKSKAFEACLELFKLKQFSLQNFFPLLNNFRNTFLLSEFTDYFASQLSSTNYFNNFATSFVDFARLNLVERQAARWQQNQILYAIHKTYVHRLMLETLQNHQFEIFKLQAQTPEERIYVKTPFFLGRGNFAEVFKAWLIDSVIPEPVVMKYVDKQKISENQKLFQSLVQEVNNLKVLNHPNIVKIYDAWQTEKHFIIVMELCRGGTLTKLIENYKRQNLQCPIWVIRPIIKQLFASIIYLHSRKIMHRDIKPDNILLADQFLEDSPPDVKIADFGFSRTLEDNQIAETFCGTGYFMSPETLNQQARFEADIWALGISIFQLITGKLLIIANSFEDLRITLQSETEPWLQKISDEARLNNWPDDLRDLLRAMLRKNIDKRIRSNQLLNHPFVNKPSTQTSTMEVSLAQASVQIISLQSEVSQLQVKLKAKEDELKVSIENQNDGFKKIEELTQQLLAIRRVVSSIPIK